MPLLLVDLLEVVVLLYSACHDSHVTIAVKWKTRWKTTCTSAKSSQKEELRLSVVVSAATGQRLV